MNNSYLLVKYKTSLERRVEYRCYEEEKEQERSCRERWETDSEGEWGEVNNCKDAWKGQGKYDILKIYYKMRFVFVCVHAYDMCNYMHI